MERMRGQTEIEMAEASNSFNEMEVYGSNSVLSCSELLQRGDWVEKTSVWDPDISDHLPLFVDVRNSSPLKLPAPRLHVIGRTGDGTTGTPLLIERAVGLPRRKTPKLNDGIATEYRRLRSLFQHVLDNFPTMTGEENLVSLFVRPRKDVPRYIPFESGTRTSNSLERWPLEYSLE